MTNDVLTPPDIAYLTELEGSIRLSEGLRLALLASVITPDMGVIVEIGSYKGMSTCFLAAGSNCGNKVPVFAIDCWNLREAYREKEYKKFHPYDLPENKAVFEKQTRPYSDVINPVQGFSAEISKTWSQKIGLLFIDGHHDESWQDYMNWAHFITPGGFLVWHDANWVGVKNTIRKIIKTKLWHRGVLINSLYSMRRKEKP